MRPIYSELSSLLPVLLFCAPLMLACGDDGGGTGGGTGGTGTGGTGGGSAGGGTGGTGGGSASACRIAVTVDGDAHLFDQNPNINVYEPAPGLGPHAYCNAAEGLVANELFQIVVPTTPGSYDCSSDQGLMITWTRMDAGWGANFGIAGSSCQVTVTAGDDASGSVVEGTFSATTLEGGDPSLPHDFSGGTFRIEIP
jgi:hypothetical protein